MERLNRMYSMRKRLPILICLLCLLAAGCSGQRQSPAVAHPKRFTAKAARIFADGTSYDLKLEARFTGSRVKAALQGEINGQQVNQKFALDGTKAERWLKIASGTAFLRPEEQTSRVEAGGTIEVHLYDAEDEEAAGEPRNPGEWRNLIIEAIKLAQLNETGLPGEK